jgi:hypothetical protein
MEENKPLRIEDVRPLKKVIREYFIKAFLACGGCRSETARRLGVNVRTVRAYVAGYEFEPEKLEEPVKPEEPVIEEFKKTGYRSVTPKQRDEWYNKDRF